MAEDDCQCIELVFQRIYVAHLPFGIAAREIRRFFEPFGMIKNLYLKRRLNKDSSIYLSNPYVILVFDKPGSVDQIMAARPLYFDDCFLFIRRFMSITPKYPHEVLFTVKKILIRTPSEKNNEILPDNESIVKYLAPANGKIVYFERLNDKTVLVQFDDYDPVDVCCLSRPHFIKNQLVEIERCSDEEQIRHRIEFQSKLNSIFIKPSLLSTTVDIDNRSMETASTTPVLSTDDQITQLRSTYNDLTYRLEQEHEQLITSLADEWKQTAKERVRLQRLTMDYKQEFERITGENRKWQKLFSDSLKEKPIVQKEGERKLNEACQKYDRSVQNIPQERN